MKKKTFAIVSSTFSHARAGGVPTYVHCRATYLSRKHNVVVLALGELHDMPVDKTEYKKFSLGNHLNFPKCFLVVWLKLIISLLRLGPDYIECHNIPVSLPVILIFRFRYFFHGPAGLEAKYERKSRFNVFMSNALELLTFVLSRRVMVISHAFKDLAQQLYPRSSKSKLAIRRPRFDTSLTFCRPVLPKPDQNSPLTLLCVRRLVKRTGVLELVHAFAQTLRDQQLPTNTRMNIVGIGPELEGIQDAIGENRLERHVHLLGKVTDAELTRLYQESHWSIVPSQELEGFGMIVVEAALEGCPSLVTNVGGLPEVINLLDGYGYVCSKNQAGLMQGLHDISKSLDINRFDLKLVAHKRFSCASKRMN